LRKEICIVLKEMNESNHQYEARFF
jgi:hypothetical protein